MMSSSLKDRGEYAWFRVLPPVLMCALLWGSAFPSIKTVYRLWDEAGMVVTLSERWWFAGVRFSIAGGLLLLVARQPMQEFMVASKPGLLRMCLAQTVGQYLFFYWGMALTAGSLAGLLASSGSFWWMLLAPLLVGSPWPSLRQWGAVAIGAVGLACAAAVESGGDDLWLGAGFLLMSSAFGTIGLIEFGKLRGAIGARAATGFSLFAGGVLLLIVGFPAFGQMEGLMSPMVVCLTLWLAFVSAAAFSLWNYLSIRFPVPLLAGYRFLIPLAGMFEAVLFLPDESLSAGLLMGAALVVVSLVLSQRWQPARESR